jgi:tetratricopeptide (TPR) repeat protein
MSWNIPKILAVFVISVTLLLSACKSYEYFNIEVLEPAELFLTPDIQTLVVAHNITTDDADSAGTPFMVYGMPGYDSLFIDTTLARTSIIGLADGLSFAGRLATVKVDSLSKTLPKYTSEYTNDDVNFIRKLCNDKAANAFVLLNKIEYENAYDVYLSKSGGYYGEFETIMKTEWLLINPFISKLIDIKTLVDTVYIQVEPLEIDEKNSGFETRKEVLAKAALAAGHEYASWISPHFVQTSRMVFKKGDENIKTGYKQAGMGNWKNAAFFWRKALSSPEPKIVAQACFNLALASEMEGLLEPALEWAKESFEYFPDTLNVTYISILEERIRQQQDILQQMDETDGGND